MLYIMSRIRDVQQKMFSDKKASDSDLSSHTRSREDSLAGFEMSLLQISDQLEIQTRFTGRDVKPWSKSRRLNPSNLYRAPQPHVCISGVFPTQEPLSAEPNLQV